MLTSIILSNATTLLTMYIRSAVLATLIGSSLAFVPSTRVPAASSLQMVTEPGMDDRRSFVTKSGSLAAAAAFTTATGAVSTPLPANAAASQMWKPIKLPFEDTLYDIDFDT